MQLLLKIPDVRPEMLSADFWINRCDAPDDVLLSTDDMTTFNNSVYQQLDMPYVLDLPDTLKATEVEEKIKLPQSLFDRVLYNGHGEQVSDFQSLIQNTETSLSGNVFIQFGITVRRTHVRVFPTDDLLTDAQHEIKTDMLQNSTIDIGWAVAIIAGSADGEWYFCLTPLVWGWVRRADIAICSREIATKHTYMQKDNFLMTVGSRSLIGLRNGGGITPQMGTLLPLLDENEAGYIVQIPTRTPEGSYLATAGFAHKEQPIHKGYLPFTRRTIINMVFDMLGERYAWGGSRLGIFGRDCSRLVQDVYATTGIKLPRNSRQQGVVTRPLITLDENMSHAERKAHISQHTKMGDLVLMRGHIMIYLGSIDDEPYVIHAIGSERMHVIVSTLSPYDDASRTLVPKISHTSSVALK